MRTSCVQIHGTFTFRRERVSIAQKVKVRAHGVMGAVRLVRMHLTPGIDGPVIGGTSMTMLVPFQVGIMQTGHGTKTTTERTGGVAADRLHQCTAGADAFRLLRNSFHSVPVVAHCLFRYRNALKSLCTRCGSSSLTSIFFEAVRILCEA